MSIQHKIAKAERTLQSLRHKHKNGVYPTEVRQRDTKAMDQLECELVTLRIRTFVSDKMIY